MSKKYQYLAKKRESNAYFETQTLCILKKPNNATNCRTCLCRAGQNRRMQQQDSAKTNIL